jgi:prepilin-type processing-associated H-X9-DG protein
MHATNLLAIAFCLFSICGDVSANAQDLSTPETAVRSFMTAYYAGDLKKAAACVEGAKYSSALEWMSRELKKQPSTYKVDNLQFHVVGDSAAVSIIGAATQPPGKPQPYNCAVKLRRSRAGWYIVPIKDERLALADSMDVVKVFVWELTNPQSATRNRDSAQRESCLSNLKQLARAVLKLMQSHNQQYSLKAGSYKQAIYPYIKDEQVFACPSDKPGTDSYSFNPHIEGLSLAKLTDSWKTVMLYEGKAGKLKFRHNGMAGVVFTDGHAKMITEEEAKKLRWMP